MKLPSFQSIVTFIKEAVITIMVIAMMFGFLYVFKHYLLESGGI